MITHSNEHRTCGLAPRPRHLTGLPPTARSAMAICVLLCGILPATDVHGQLATPTAAFKSSPTGASTIGGVFQHGDQSYQVVRAANYSESADVGAAAANTVAQAGSFLDVVNGRSGCDAGCDACDGLGSYGTCSSCGVGGSSGMRGVGGYGMGFSCPTCEPMWYGKIETLSMRRNGDRRFTSSPDYFLDRYDYEWAPRITLGYVPDCVNGYEISYTGPLEWNRDGRLSNDAGGIGTFLFAVPPVLAADLSAFSNAVEQAQFNSADYWSLELSNAMVGWDVAKLLSGVRYIDYDENFLILSRTATETGLLSSAVQNQMVGFQVGMDLLYPVCNRWDTDMRVRAGVYANFIDLNLQVVNAGSTTALLQDNSTKLAGVLEFGSGIRYQVCDLFALRTGFEVWYLHGIASAHDQFSGGILSRRNVRGSDDFLAVGVNAGAEFRY